MLAPTFWLLTEGFLSLEIYLLSDCKLVSKRVDNHPPACCIFPFKICTNPAKWWLALIQQLCWSVSCHLLTTTHLSDIVRLLQVIPYNPVQIFCWVQRIFHRFYCNLHTRKQAQKSQLSCAFSDCSNAYMTKGESTKAWHHSAAQNFTYRRGFLVVKVLDTSSG